MLKAEAIELVADLQSENAELRGRAIEAEREVNRLRGSLSLMVRAATAANQAVAAVAGLHVGGGS